MARLSRRGVAFVALILALTVITALPALGESGASSTVFINEIHYDNAGTDTGEAIEVAGPASTDLSGWSLVLYNGNNGTSYNTVPLAGVLADQSGGYGTVTVDLPTNGLQNGSPDGLALVNGASVVQFLSYEGTFSAIDGPASGMNSTDIGVSETSSTPVGQSLQLTGTGTTAGDFTWNAAAAASFGAPNVGQTFEGVEPPEATPVINEFVFNHIGSDTEAFIEIAGDPSTDYANLTVLEIEGDTTGSGVIDAALPVGTTDANGYWTDDEDPENGTVTLLLVDGFTGSVGDDLDVDNDGVLDSTPWGEIVDDIAVSDGYSGDHTYGLTLVSGFDGGSFTVGGASRIPDQVDTDTVGDWMRNDYFGAGFPGFAGAPKIGEAFNTPGAVNEPILVEKDLWGACFENATKIHTIQGSGFDSEDVGNTRTIEGVVVGDFEGYDALAGFYLQEEDGDVDGDPATSEGIFVYNWDNNDVSIGDTVRARGEVTEYYGLTEITSLTDLEVCAGGTGGASPSVLYAPLADIDREAVEGMAVQFPDGLFVTDMYNLHRYGEAWLGIGGVVEQPTNEFGGGTVEMEDLAADNMLRSILLDDGSGNSDPRPIPYLHSNGTLRLGDSTDDATAIMSYGFSQYRLQPVDVVFDATNPRPTGAPDVGGDLVVGSMNVLNYWTSTGCGYDCRGAQTEDQLEVQTDKLVAALLGMDADVIALQEMENAPFDEEVKTGEAVLALIGAMNDEMGSDVWTWVGPVAQNSYPIVNEIIFRSDRVSQVGDPMSLADPAFDEGPPDRDPFGRRPVAQTFDADGGEFTIVVNHFKSKGSSCGEPNEGADGQGNCNLRRVAQAQAVLDWVEELKLVDPDVLVVGDLNAYMAEDPIKTLETGLTNLVTAFDADPYSYVFFADFSFPYVGRGSLDHAFATGSLFDQVTDTATWHINADEPRFLDWYDISITAPGEFRSSDHDPVLIGLTLDNEPPTLDLSVSPNRLWPPNHKYRTVTVTVETSDDSGTSFYELVSVESSEADCCLGKDDLPNDIVDLGDDQFDLRAERFSKDGRTYTITYRAWDAAGNETFAEVRVVVPHSQRNKFK